MNQILEHKRVAAGVGRQLAVFIAAYAIGAIVASFVSPFLSPFLSFLAIPLIGGVTVLFAIINGLVTFPIYAWLANKYSAEPDL